MWVYYWPVGGGMNNVHIGMGVDDLDGRFLHFEKDFSNEICQQREHIIIIIIAFNYNYNYYQSYFLLYHFQYHPQTFLIPYQHIYIQIIMKFSLSSVIILASFAQTSAFSVAPSRSLSYNTATATATATTLFNAAEPTDDEMESVLEKSKLSDDEVQKVGNLVADDEWMGLGMELSEIVRVAVIENAKAGTADFIGKDEYKVGDISKEIDTRVKVS